MIPRFTQQQAANRLAAFGITLTGQYVNANTPVEMVCDKGHSLTRRPANVWGVLRHGCSVCSGNHRQNQQQAAERMAAYGFKLVGHYAGAETPVEVLCSEGHSTKRRPTDVWNAKTGCRVCSPSGGNLGNARARNQTTPLSVYLCHGVDGAGTRFLKVGAGSANRVRVNGYAGLRLYDASLTTQIAAYEVEASTIARFGPTFGYRPTGMPGWWSGYTECFAGLPAATVWAHIVAELDMVDQLTEVAA